MNPFFIGGVGFTLTLALCAWLSQSREEVVPSPPKEKIETDALHVVYGEHRAPTAQSKGAAQSKGGVQSKPKVSTPSEVFERFCRYTPPKGFNAAVTRAAKKEGVNPRILALTVYRESGCDSRAIGSSGEVGLGQIMPQVWLPKLKGIAKSRKDLLNPEVNLRATAHILALLYKEQGSAMKTLQAYNGGRKGVRYAKAQAQAYRKLWGGKMWVRP